MSEIKGQLLGIIMVLVIFAAISVTVGTIFANMEDSIFEKSTDLTKPMEDSFASNVLSYSNNG